MTDTPETTTPPATPAPVVPPGRIWLVSYFIRSDEGMAALNAWIGMPAKDPYAPDNGLTIKWVEGVKAGLAEAHKVEPEQIVFSNMIEMESLAGLETGTTAPTETA